MNLICFFSAEQVSAELGFSRTDFSRTGFQQNWVLTEQISAERVLGRTDFTRSGFEEKENRDDCSSLPSGTDRIILRLQILSAMNDDDQTRVFQIPRQL